MPGYSSAHRGQETQLSSFSHAQRQHRQYVLEWAPPNGLLHTPSSAAATKLGDGAQLPHISLPAPPLLQEPEQLPPHPQPPPPPPPSLRCHSLKHMQSHGVHQSTGVGGTLAADWYCKFQDKDDSLLRAEEPGGAAAAGAVWLQQWLAGTYSPLLWEQREGTDSAWVYRRLRRRKTDLTRKGRKRIH